MLKKYTFITQCCIFFSALILSVSLYAEQTDQQQGERKGHKGRFEKMAQKMNLNDQQKAELKPMLEKLNKERMETLKALNEKQNKELSSILNPKQMEQIKRHLKRHKHKGGKKGKMNPKPKDK